MSYRVPTVEVLAVAISDVLREHGAISSQRLFAEFVREKLKNLDQATPLPRSGSARSRSNPGW
jgi:hypothetical protein